MKLLIISLIFTLFITSCGVNSSQDVPSSVESSTSEENKLKEGMLFDHGTMGESQFYNYAPSFFEEDNKRYIYYCSNYIEGNVTDVIGYREGVKDENGNWVYTDFDYVFGPTEDTWDSRHTCDPSVIKGEFTYDGEEYSYLMAYLGCVTSNNQLNEVGLAVSKTPAGPWVKTNKINPIAKYEKLDNNGFQWGYGQPSLVSIDRQSRVLLFYTVGNGVATYTQVERWDFADLNNPIKEEEKIVTTKGITTKTGGFSFISNADFAYDPVKKRIYAVMDDRPFDTESPDFIASANIFAYFAEFSNVENYEPGSTLFSPMGQSWSIITRIDESISGYPRNHNMGILTDPYGWIIDPNNIEVAYAVSILADGNGWWYWSTYRLFLTQIAIKE